MKVKKLNWFLVMAIMLAFSSGCARLRGVEAFSSPTNFDPDWSGDYVARRFEDNPSQEPTGLESAIKLSEKYAKLSDEAAALREQKKQLEDENKRLKEQVANLDHQLRQTQKELDEANNLLRDMVVELNNWKSSVLGFREEMRDAQKAQLEALLKILTVLGGEPGPQEPETGGQEAGIPADVSASKGDQDGVESMKVAKNAAKQD